MTGFDLLRILTKMPNEVLRRPVYCGVNLSDIDEIADVFVDDDGTVAMFTIEDRAMDEGARTFKGGEYNGEYI